MSKTFCKPCWEKGHECETENMVDGQYVCVFCEDNLPCPVTQRLTKNGHQPTAEPKPLPEPAFVTCKVQGCDRVLRKNNRSGYCFDHRTLGATKKPKLMGEAKAKRPAKAKTDRSPSNIRPIAAQAASAVERLAPSATDTLNSGQQLAVEAANIVLTSGQLVALFTAWPLERQAAAVQHVFNQELGQ